MEVVAYPLPRTRMDALTLPLLQNLALGEEVVATVFFGTPRPYPHRHRWRR
uniref:Uncharacterized protein n=1 Tax=Triticum urartu TaxID=4572 RepID=A0A8R7PUR9_TRIUA